MKALVPLMTLWSCGGVVIRVRADGTETQQICSSILRGWGGAFSSMHLAEAHNHSPHTTRSADASSMPLELLAMQV